MNDKNREPLWDEMERLSKILERIAKNYPQGSEEELALREAALALVFVQQRKALMQAYLKLREVANGELSEEAKERLRPRGIDVDNLEEEAQEGMNDDYE